MINLDIELTKEDLEVLSLMDFSEEDYADYGSYSVAIELKSIDVDENYLNGISEGMKELESERLSFNTKLQNLLSKIKKVEENNVR